MSLCKAMHLRQWHQVARFVSVYSTLLAFLTLLGLAIASGSCYRLSVFTTLGLCDLAWLPGLATLETPLSLNASSTSRKSTSSRNTYDFPPPDSPEAKQPEIHAITFSEEQGPPECWLHHCAENARG